MTSERSGKMEIYITHDLSNVESIRRVNRTRCARDDEPPFLAADATWIKKTNGATL